MKSNKSNGQLTAQINVSDHKKSGFDLSNNVLGTGKIGRIIPTRALHVMPGDTIKADSKVAVQFEPLAVPILANMDVKQEHFYVPYNIVWKNWDKFISGGEKMDYNGVVPSVSMQSLFFALDEQLSDYDCSLSLNIVQTTNVTANHLVDKSLADSMIVIDGDAFLGDGPVHHLDLRAFGESYNALDLIKPQFETLRLLREFRQSSWINTEPIFYSVKIAPSASVTIQRIKSIINDNPYIFSSKYIKEILPAIESYVENNFNTDMAVVLPTDYGVSYMQLVYEYYKPFIGIGSNLDYLNMSRVTFADFLYVLTLCMSKSVNDQLYTLDEASVLPSSFFHAYFASTPMSVLHLRANYNIWYNNYRDILLEANADEPVDTDDVWSREMVTLLFPRQRCWEKDAFTTALDNPGTGNVGVPLTSQYAGSSYSIVKSHDDVPSAVFNDGADIAEVSFEGKSYKLPTSLLTGVNPLVEEDSLTLDGFSLYALDAAQRAQKWLQKALFYGNRINDFYNIRFGVRYLDARLHLPELLTSSSQLVRIDVLMNNTTTSESIAGDRAGFASAYDDGSNFDRFCEEHGVIMSYMTIMPQVTYAYGMSRDYSRLDQFDFAFPEFATLGIDAVYDSEITSMSTDVNVSRTEEQIQVFGYQGKYYDYKAKHSEEHGELLDTQDMYTFARKFNMYDPDGRPKLNYEFVHCFPDLDMFVVDSPLADYFRYDIRHSTAAERELPVHSIYI